MERIITYSIINSNLRPSSTLSPSNRCACKKNALEAHGKNIYGTDAAFPQNRLIWNYDLEEFTVTWDFGGAPGYNPSQVSVDYGTKVADASKPADPMWDVDHRFDGWFIGDTPLGQQTVTGNTTVTAHWTYTPPAPTYTISFIDKDGGSLGSQTGHSGDTVTTPNAPAVSGYIFTGWQNTSNPSDFIPAGTTTITVSGNATYQATYRPEHTVVMSAEVFWKGDLNDHGSQTYETTDWLKSDKVPINQRFEPMYKVGANGDWDAGTEVGYTTTIATIDGTTNVTHDDLMWEVVISPSTGGEHHNPSTRYNIDAIFRLTNTDGANITYTTVTSDGTYSVHPSGVQHKGYGMAVSSTTWDQDIYWEDVIPVKYIAKYNGSNSQLYGVTVFEKTINVVTWSLPAIAGFPYFGYEASVNTAIPVGNSLSTTTNPWGGSWLVSIHPVSD